MKTTATNTFQVEVKRGRSRYRTVCSIEGELLEAVILYKNVNLENGFKKRLTSNGKTLIYSA